MRLEDASRTLARALAMAEGLAPSREDSLFPRTSPPANALRRALESTLRKLHASEDHAVGACPLAGPAEKLVFLALLHEACRWARVVHPVHVAAELEALRDSVVDRDDPVRPTAAALDDSLTEVMENHRL